MFEYGAWGVSSARDPLGVVDGDTLHVLLDLGVEELRRMTLRVYGVNAPELSTSEGGLAKAWAVGWFRAHCPDNWFIVNTVKDRTEKFGRYLAVVTAPDGAVFNDDVVSAGHAVPYFPKRVGDGR